MNIIISAQIDFTAQKNSYSGQKWILIVKSWNSAPRQNEQNFTWNSRNFNFMASILPWDTYESLPKPSDSVAYSFVDSNLQGFSLRRFTFREIDVWVTFSGHSVKNTKNVKKKTHTPYNEKIKNLIHTKVSLTYSQKGGFFDTSHFLGKKQKMTQNFSVQPD